MRFSLYSNSHMFSVLSGYTIVFLVLFPHAHFCVEFIETRRDFITCYPMCYVIRGLVVPIVMFLVECGMALC